MSPGTGASARARGKTTGVRELCGGAPSCDCLLKHSPFATAKCFVDGDGDWILACGGG